MSRYPYVLLFRHNTYSKIDTFIEDNKDSLMCSIHIINDISHLNKLYNPNYHLLVTYGNTYDEYNYIAKQIPDRFSSRWFHKSDISNIDEFNYNVNYCYISYVIDNRVNTRPIFSIFTTCFKSYDYIKTAYESIKKQSLIDWEWVIMDDTPEDAHFVFLKEKLAQDNRVRLYKRDKNSGNIGNVKNEAISLCRGKYILEMDHDDEILENCLLDSYNIFESDPEIGFVYADTIGLYRNGSNYHYGDFICKGYGGYYCEKINDKWINVYVTPNINNITLSHLVCLPNHPRIWKRSILMELESYSEFLPICDDYEILLKTCCSKYKVVKNNKAQYIQYANDDGNNFSTIRNSEINRIGPQYIGPMFYEKYRVHDKMKKLDAYEDEKYLENLSPIWKREQDYQHKKMNSTINLDYDKCVCIINNGINNIEINNLYKTPRCDIIWLCNNQFNLDFQKKIVDSKKYDNMKIYNYNDCSEEELIKWFNMLYLHDNCQSLIITDNKEINAQISDIHSQLKLNNGSFLDELPEQKLTLQYFTGNEQVLEIGGNIGRNSLIIGHILKDNTNFVTMESDEENALMLNNNRNLNNMKFHIESAALSSRKLIQQGWVTEPSDILKEGYQWVNTITWKELNNKYNINFDTLILDCEGAFYYILKDTPEILNNIKLIIMENDYRIDSQKEYVDTILRENNFYVDYLEIGPLESEWSSFKDKFFEVWKKSINQ